MKNKFDFSVIIRQTIHKGSRRHRFTHNQDNKCFFTKIKLINHTDLYFHK